MDAAIKAFTDQGFEVALNKPFAGTLILTPFWQRNTKVMGMMIEIRRDVYMNESEVTLTVKSKEVRPRVCSAISKIAKK